MKSPLAPLCIVFSLLSILYLFCDDDLHLIFSCNGGRASSQTVVVREAGSLVIDFSLACFEMILGVQIHEYTVIDGELGSLKEGKVLANDM